MAAFQRAYSGFGVYLDFLVQYVPLKLYWIFSEINQFTLCTSTEIQVPTELSCNVLYVKFSSKVVTIYC